MERLLMNKLENEQNGRDVTADYTVDDDCFDQLPTLPLPVFSLDQLPTQLDLTVINKNAYWYAYETQDGLPISEMLTWVLPVVSAKQINGTGTQLRKAGVAAVDGHILLLRNLVKSSGVYALSAIAGPLISLALAPFLTHSLSPTDYGILTILSTAISLGAGITQMGLATAFFRAYNYDFTSPGDRRYILTTTSVLLCLISIPLVVGAAIEAPYL